MSGSPICSGSEHAVPWHALPGVTLAWIPINLSHEWRRTTVPPTAHSSSPRLWWISPALIKPIDCIETTWTDRSSVCVCLCVCLRLDRYQVMNDVAQHIRAKLETFTMMQMCVWHCYLWKCVKWQKTTWHSLIDTLVLAVEQRKNICKLTLGNAIWCCENL